MGLDSSSARKISGGDIHAQYSTFFVAGRMYGIDVTRVQEVVKPMMMTRIPLAEGFVRGLINLRGQVTTAIGMRELLGIPTQSNQEPMNVVCRCDGNLISLLVDEIGDVIEVSSDDYESAPQTIPLAVRRYMSGVYKLKGSLLSVLDIDLLFKHVNS